MPWFRPFQMTLKAAPEILALLFLLSACQAAPKGPEVQPTFPLTTVTPVVLGGELNSQNEPGQPPLKTASLVLQPPAEAPQAGTEFTVAVILDTGGQDVDTVQVSLNFDPQYFAVQALEPGKSLTTELQASFDNQAGTIDYAAGVLGGHVQGEVPVVQIRMKSLAKTTAVISQLSFHFGLPRETGVYAQGYPVLVEDGAEDIKLQINAASNN